MLQYRPTEPPGHWQNFDQFGDWLARTIVGWMLFLAVCALLLIVELLWREAKVVARTLRHHGDDVTLRRSLTLFLGLALGGLFGLLVAAQTRSEVLGVLAFLVLVAALMSFVWFVIVCHFVELRHAKTFKKRQPLLVTQVWTKRPWSA